MTFGILKPFFRRSSSQKFPAIVVLIVSYQFYDKVRDRVRMIQVVFLEFFKKVWWQSISQKILDDSFWLFLYFVRSHECKTKT